uniref:WW domain-containing protein n=1 Tax=Babesia bovis TaxID=5865 RepID=A7AVS9_BABBO|eukprot:XP_001609473.1 hypothetical protein [Babesia bovis T2Bo]
MGDIGVPKSWDRLGDTKWYRVETSTKKVYYYNRCTKESRWEMPDIGIPEKPSSDSAGSISADDLNNFKSLIKELNLPASTRFDEALPKLLFDSRFTRIPQPERRRVFQQCQRDIVRESSRSIGEIVKSYGVEVDNSNNAKALPVKRSRGDRLTEPDRPGIESNAQRSRKPRIEVQSRESLAASMAHNAFMSMLHERIRMPFLDGEIVPLDDDLLQGDPRAEGCSAKDRKVLYDKFVSEFLEARLALFDQKLSNIGSEQVSSSLDEKAELLDDFNLLLRQTVCHHDGSLEENLTRIKSQLRNDPRLGVFREERDRLVMQRLSELESEHIKNRH